jgi:hypothetical protein
VIKVAETTAPHHFGKKLGSKGPDCAKESRGTGGAALIDGSLGSKAWYLLPKMNRVVFMDFGCKVERLGRVGNFSLATNIEIDA